MPKEEIPITELPHTAPDPKEYWAIYAHTLDWQVLLHRFVSDVDPSRGTKPLDPKIGVIGYEVNSPNPVPIWYLSREFFPVEKIAKLIGKDPSALAGIETLHLKEFKDADGQPATKDWQAPTVDYWGMG